MVATIDRWVAGVALVLGGLVAAGMLACASTQPQQEPDATTEAGAADVLSDVRVEQAEEATLVILSGPTAPVFSAFERANPPSVVVDLSGVEAEVGEFPQAGVDPLVEHVSVSPFATGSGEPMTRVEISVATPVRYEVRDVAEGVAVHLLPALEEVADAEEALAEEDVDDPWADPAPLASADAAADHAADEESALEPQVAMPASPATTLRRVTVTPTESGVLVHLVADGAVEETSAFTLADPARLVVDLPGLESKVAKPRSAVSDSFVTGVRVGAHSDKVRVVIDARDPEHFAGRRVVPVPDGLVVTLGSGEALDAALAEAEGSGAPVLAAAEPAEEKDALETAMDDLAEETAADASVEPVGGDGVHVYGVHFEPQREKDRLVVLSSAPARYALLRPDPETLVVSFSGATIAPDAAVRITPEAGGPVSLVSAFEQPEVEPSEVRVVVKRAKGLEPEVSQKGSLLFLDFAHTGVARTAPVFEAPVPTTEAGSLADSLGTNAAFPPLPEAADSEEAGAAVAPAEDGVLLPDLASLEGGSAPAPTASTAPETLSSPASLEPPAAVDILQEGGLIEGKEYRGRRISLDFKDVDIADVLRLIAEVSDLNIIAGEEVEGKVTIRLVDVPWDQALDVILLTKGLGFVRVGNVLRIAPADILAQEEEMRLQERRAKEKLEDLVVKLQPVNYASVDEVSKMVQRLLSPRGTVNVDKRTSTLIIKDIPSVIDEATALVKAIDTQTPQVLIEAKIVEANLDFSRELGSVWSFGSQPLVDGFDSGSGPRTDLGGGDFKWHGNNNVAFANPITSLASGLYNMNAFILDEKLNLNLQLQAAESNGDGKVISSPRVVTLDNREAEIEQGVSIPFQTFENGDAQLEFIDAVLSLKVTPHITADRSIIMEIEVTRNAPDDTVPTPTGSPAIAKNQAETETLVKDGQTLVIGGIYTINKTERQSRVPYLHAIPLIGAAFKSREVSDQRKELLIFVTPRVVQQPEVAS